MLPLIHVQWDKKQKENTCAWDGLHLACALGCAHSTPQGRNADQANFLFNMAIFGPPAPLAPGEVLQHTLKPGLWFESALPIKKKYPGVRTHLKRSLVWDFPNLNILQRFSFMNRNVGMKGEKDRESIQKEAQKYLSKTKSRGQFWWKLLKKKKGKLNTTKFLC